MPSSFEAILAAAYHGQGCVQRFCRLLREKPKENTVNLCLARRGNSEENDPMMSCRRITENVTKVLVIAEQDHRALDRELQDLRVRTVLFGNILQTNDSKPCVAKKAHRCPIDAVIGEDQARGISSTT